ncbi:MAG: copper homeostasis protein CutC [Clostridium sp.]|uniref:copper homeostasis protein CutC n=1 Tax=Clostridium sp. TaxID=1506 RepID=UPI001ED6194B|nr:copper homeostasis protein CutC [Clostridium sp.]MBS5884103.1 copper homeostasis protein CutC [Clostridium sp.]MDU7148009.1 copper homeostasis protein CutC [Clostridium sp.]MDU7241258.1 copper homeostasis protein CutC [Clostridium sp.]
MIKEVAIGNISQGLEFDTKNADRYELCDNMLEGGTTPSYGTIKAAIEQLKAPSMVMIRPRGGDFVYRDYELEIMINDIKVCKELGAKGIVLGVLTEENEIDYQKTKMLIDLAKPMEVVFHKAIDLTKDPVKEVKKLANLGIDRILTSGGEKTAVEGIEVLKSMIEESKGTSLKIVVAGKVSNDNIDFLSEHLNTDEFHGSTII